ncbi:H-NS histone family protein [Alphaproteobacteria bacterium]|nr:H-NS histone family protein [Alphaproteobacteria bacterium]
MIAAKRRQAAEVNKKRFKKIRKIVDLMAEAEVTLDDIKDLKKRKKPKSKRSGKAVAPKYKLVVNGKENLWSGRGRTPKIFQEYCNAGNSRESYEIRKLFEAEISTDVN